MRLYWGMSSVAERLSEQSRARLHAMTPAERVSEALRLGARAVEVYGAAHELGRDDARRRLERVAQAGRRASRVMRGIIE